MEVTLRVHLVDPPPGVLFRLQTKKRELLDPLETTAVYAGGDWKGPAVHGPPGARFLYVNFGKSAGDSDSPWERRAKIGLKDLTPTPGLWVGSVAGRAKDGGPCCATVPVTWSKAE